MKKYLQDLSRDELQALFDNNERLRVAIWENAIESVDFWIGEKLSGFGRKNFYSIGTYGSNYIKVNDISEFLEWVKDCNSVFCVFDGLENLIEKAFVLYEKLRYYDLSDLNYERVENRLDEIVEMLSDCFLDDCNNEYDWYYDDRNLFSFWLEEIAAGVGYWDGYYAIYRDYTEAIA